MVFRKITNLHIIFSTIVSPTASDYYYLRFRNNGELQRETTNHFFARALSRIYFSLPFIEPKMDLVIGAKIYFEKKYK